VVGISGVRYIQVIVECEGFESRNNFNLSVAVAFQTFPLS